MKHPIKKAFFAGGIVIGILIAAFVVFHKTDYSTNEYLSVDETISTQGSPIFVRVAQTDRQRELGLSHFKSLPSNQGMLFVFNEQGIYPFWMKGMTFPLDMVWLRSVGGGTGTAYTIDSVTYSATPDSYPKTFQSAGPIDAVLEIPAGQARLRGLYPGAALMVRKGVYSKSGTANP